MNLYLRNHLDLRGWKSPAQCGCSAFRKPCPSPPGSYFYSYLVWFLSLCSHLRPGLNLTQGRGCKRPHAGQVLARRGSPHLWDSMAGEEAPLPHDGQIEPLGFQLKWKIWNIRAVVAQSVSPPQAGRAGAPPGSSLGSGGFLVTSPGQGLNRVIRKMAMHGHSPWLERAGARESLHLPSPRTGREPGRHPVAEGTAPQMLGNTK